MNYTGSDALIIDERRATAIIERVMRVEGAGGEFGVYRAEVGTGKQQLFVSVQNLFNLTDRSAEELLDHATSEGIAFIPWFPLATGGLVKDGGPLEKLAAEHDATPSQLALAWLLKRSPVMLPIPGTSTVSHLEDNIGGAGIELTDEQFAALDAIA